ncbi:heterogeneous nuclear ribonucleoprotein L-like isoform X1 [Manduca sexta]|uniref:heterogeneous nuclear ribonucleoprotein L-like isoform X1 n=1 Tax=Manduca sexta TaxID=7130 RepID=UPI00188FD39B|nr:heterogeneous nuclear ribonucleoprotein L-like isoform X1 [Manduca sexta]
MHHPSMPPQNQQGAVMMVYGLDPQTANADRLFNLCCLYGNVVRIKFLKTKEGTAMVQMGDGVSVERCVQNLNNVTVGEYTLTLAFSKQAYLSEVMNPYPLPDKSPSFKDYVGNKNNRFLTPASIHKNRIQPRRRCCTSSTRRQTCPTSSCCRCSRTTASRRRTPSPSSRSRVRDHRRA